MTKSRRFVLLGLLFVAIGISLPALAAQESALIELLRVQIKTDRQAVVDANMDLSETQAEKFWPVYKEYVDRRDSLVDRRVTLLIEFRDNRMGMTAQQARQTLTDALQLHEDIVKLQKKYVRDFQNALGPRAALRFYQIENKLNAVINFELASVVPLRQ